MSRAPLWAGLSIWGGWLVSVAVNDMRASFVQVGWAFGVTIGFLLGSRWRRP